MFPRREPHDLDRKNICHFGAIQLLLSDLVLHNLEGLTETASCKLILVFGGEMSDWQSYIIFLFYI